MPAKHSNTNRVITILIPSDKTLFQNVFVTLFRRVAKDVTSSLLSWHKRYDLMPQIFDVTVNGNALYKRNELEYRGTSIKVDFATLSLYASSGPKAKGVPTNNMRERGSGPCRSEKV